VDLDPVVRRLVGIAGQARSESVVHSNRWELKRCETMNLWTPVPSQTHLVFLIKISASIYSIEVNLRLL
jgi:hypothetical protein